MFASNFAAIVGAGVSGAVFGLVLRQSEAIGWFLVHAPLLGGIACALIAIWAIIAARVIDSVKSSRLTGRLISTVGYVVLQLPLLLLLLFELLGPETICIWDPLRDTNMATPSIRTQFEQVSVGMSTSQLVEAIGEPLLVVNDLWYYTTDGKCGRGCDKAWLLLATQVSDGRVIRVLNQWAMD